MPRSTLNELQNDFLKAFFGRQNSFFLSGGGALVGFYLGHRETHDLDLFTLKDEIETGYRLVKDVAADLSAVVEAIQTSPDFRRLLLRRDGDAIIVDLIREYVFQTDLEKPIINGIRVDTPKEILANKLCALVSRSEIRDLVDVRELENSGFDVAEALPAASKKDTGFTAAQLAWILSQITFDDDVQLPGDVPPSVLRDYLAALVDRLERLALPG